MARQTLSSGKAYISNDKTVGRDILYVVCVHSMILERVYETLAYQKTSFVTPLLWLSDVVLHCIQKLLNVVFLCGPGRIKCSERKYVIIPSQIFLHF
jgi:hypothetical protein